MEGRERGEMWGRGRKEGGRTDTVHVVMSFRKV